MNRQQFLAELSQYLTFFSPKEQATIIADITEKFDAAGLEGETALIAELGSPMATVIDLKRRKEAGEKITASSVRIELETDGFTEQYSIETDTYESLTEPESLDGASDAGEQDKHASYEVSAGKKPSRPKFVFAIIGSTIVSLLITAFFLVIGAAGVMLIVAMCYLAFAGIQSIQYLTDALLLLGGGLFSGGIGLIITWFAIWSAASLISKLFHGASRYRPITGKKRCNA